MAEDLGARGVELGEVVDALLIVHHLGLGNLQFLSDLSVRCVVFFDGYGGDSGFVVGNGSLVGCWLLQPAYHIEIY